MQKQAACLTRTARLTRPAMRVPDLPPPRPSDPLGWTIAFTLAFLGLLSVRLTLIPGPYFDEIHYLPAARAVLGLAPPLNIEHPPLGKQLIAFGIALFGDRPLGWRIMPALFGALALFAATRAMWFASLSRFTTLAFAVLLATGFPLLVHSRIAMLDGFMVGFAMLALWMIAAACRQPETARWRLAVAGVALGLSAAAKWNAAPLLPLPGLVFMAMRLRQAGLQFLTFTRGAPIPGMNLAEAALWLGLVPLAAYMLTYWPFWVPSGATLPWDGLVGLHERMLELHEQVLTPHTYQSVWYQWVINLRAIWYLYEPIAGAQRGVLLVGNPLTMLLGLPALAWCAWQGLVRRRLDCLAVSVLYAVTLCLWIIGSKPVQFYYHYFLPSCFLLSALALALGELWQTRRRLGPLLVLAGSCAMFAVFWPILTAASLDGPQSFARWTWLDSWR
jgi:dolichyl-phosphate-mannose--protein O-mannosyl transferase